MASLTVDKIISSLERLAPSSTAEDWDNVGLLAGDPEWETQGAVVSIDLTPEAIDLARKKKYKLIVNHHPCIFPRSRGLNRVVASKKAAGSSLVFEALRNGIAVASYHTNFDVCSLEVVKAISHALGVKPMGRLLDQPDEALLKLSVFVPSEHLEKVREALSRAGAGHIGNYSDCSFSTPGEGTFRGGADTQPFVGKPGRLEKAREHRLETVFPAGLEREILAALMKSHPYEEVAYDLYPVRQKSSPKGLARGLGYGFWGEFPAAKPFPEVARNVTSLFNISGFLLTDPAPSRVKRVAFVAGKGASFVEAASSLSCDLFITGEAGYHTALSGARNAMAVMELGHRESERFFLLTMEGWLAEMGLKSESINSPTQRFWPGG